MQYYNSRNRDHAVDFRQALWEGLAPEGGLYCPQYIPKWSNWELNEILTMNRHDLATEILYQFVKPVLTKEELFRILESTISFDIPVHQVTSNTSILELFHGPTEAFKDVGARFMARSLSHFLGDEKLTILVATSGDTGSAVAHGFWNVEGIDVIVLFPKGRVSPYQESQMTTLGNNITAVEVEGTFDDCQDLVKRAFQDESIRKEKTLSSANSINIGRLLPQMLYYYFLAQQIDTANRDQYSICVPSGNFGNITSGLYAHLSGLDFGQFIAATNSNTTFPEYLKSGTFSPRASVATLSNAMDVGKPSNFERMFELFGGSHHAMQLAIKSIGVTDEETIETIRNVFHDYNYLLDPHAAVGWKAIEKLNGNDGYKHVVLGTAHPRKFEYAVHQALPNVTLEFPINEREKKKIGLANDYGDFKNLVLSHT